VRLGNRDGHLSESTECVVINDHLMSVVALRTLKGAEAEPHACRHDASDHHVSLALWAGRAVDENADVFGQGMGFWHDASLKEAGAQHSQSPV
jgi:hypothetical protein